LRAESSIGAAPDATGHRKGTGEPRTV